MEMSGPAEARVAHPVIQRFFEISLYLLTFTAFAMLAGTGKLDSASLTLAFSALAARGYLLLRQSKAKIPEQWTSYLSIAYAAFFVLDYFVLAQTFIGALVHMVLFAASVKIFSIHRERDYVYLGMLSFGMVLAAAVLTVDSLFFAMFCLFVLLAVTTFVSLEMRRSWIAAQVPVPTGARDFRDLKRLPGSVIRASALLVLSIVVGTVVLFFLIPRKTSTGYLSTLSSRSDLTTGFSDEVRLGEIGRIQQSDAVVMHVKFAPDTRVPHDLRWRGVALTSFDGRRWTGPRSHDGNLEPMNSSWAIGLMAPTGRQFTAEGVRVRYKVSLEPFGSRVFFLLPEPQLINGKYQMIRIDSTGSVFTADDSRAVTDYTALSKIPPPMPANVSTIDDRGVGDVYLQLPPSLDNRVLQLADRTTANQQEPFLKASVLERYLATSYGYTLQLPSAPPKDPIADFLFERKQGHCEYFASSMVLMLRSIGIPARLVNGFRGGEYNDVTGSYIVRAKDAHSWVEAYFAGYGWYTFDPTPSSPSSTPSSWARVYLYVDAMREVWRDWVVNYDVGHQNILGIAVVRQSRFTWANVRRGLDEVYESALRVAKALRTRVQRHPRAWGLWTGTTLVVGLLLLLGPPLWLALWRMQLARKPSLAPQTAATLWYERLIKLLSRRGVSKSPTHTPQEFVTAIPSNALRQHVQRFTMHYERARFGDSGKDAEKLPAIYECIDVSSRK